MFLLRLVVFNLGASLGCEHVTMAHAHATALHFFPAGVCAPARAYTAVTLHGGEIASVVTLWNKCPGHCHSAGQLLCARALWTRLAFRRRASVHVLVQCPISPGKPCTLVNTLCLIIHPAPCHSPLFHQFWRFDVRHCWHYANAVRLTLAKTVELSAMILLAGIDRTRIACDRRRGYSSCKYVCTAVGQASGIITQ